jgi:hypothetical protein
MLVGLFIQFYEEITPPHKLEKNVNNQYGEDPNGTHAVKLMRKFW